MFLKPNKTKERKYFVPTVILTVLLTIILILAFTTPYKGSEEEAAKESKCFTYEVRLFNYIGSKYYFVDDYKKIGEKEYVFYRDGELYFHTKLSEDVSIIITKQKECLEKKEGEK